MSIENKLIYLNGTKEKLKDSINNIGGSITDETTFRAYATELDTIYTNLPKTTGEGSNLSLTTLKGRINVDDILGDTSQFTTTGKNLLEITTTSASTKSGVTFTPNSNGKISFSGTSEGVYYNCFANINTTISLTEGTTYYIKANGTSSDVGIYVLYNSASQAGALVWGTNEGTWTIPSGVTNITVRAVVKSANVNTTGQSIFPTISTTSGISPEIYTGGTASPNPTYPQDINVVTGTQEVVVQNRNLFDGELELGSLASGNKVSSTTIYRSKNYTIVAPNTQYIFSINGTANRVVVQFFTSQKVWIDRDNSAQGTLVGNTGIFTTPANCHFIMIRCYTDDFSAFGSGNLQIELGSTATSYIEHQEQTKTLHLGDIELAKIGNYIDRIFESSGKNLLDISKFEEHYTIDSNGLPAYNGGQTRITNTTPINVEGIDKVTLTCTLNGKSFIYSLLKADNTLISRVVGNSSGTTITIGEAKYLYICFYDNATLSNITDAMLNTGSTALPYEPYGSDKWYIEKNIGTRNLNNATSFTYDATNVIWYYSLSQRVPNTDTTQTIFSDKLFWNGNFNGVVNAGSNMTNFQIATNNNGTSKNIFIKNTNYNSVDGFMNWLNTLNPVIYYQMATPTYEEITNETLQNELNELEKMMSYNGQTNISVSGNLPMILDITALKGE